jgi:hypothetical protein
MNEPKLRVASGFRQVASPPGQLCTATIAPPGVPAGPGAEADVPLPSTIHWSWPVSRKQDKRPKALASRLAWAAVKNAGPQRVTPGMPGAGPAAGGNGPGTGRRRAACRTAPHLALDICPVHGDTGGPVDALDRLTRTSPASATATATDKTPATRAARS